VGAQGTFVWVWIWRAGQGGMGMQGSAKDSSATCFSFFIKSKFKWNFRDGG
jgi:hypothetical protein